MNIPRLKWDEYFMLNAALVATRSTCDRGPELLFDSRRHGVGAVIVKSNRIIASGYNGSPPGEPHCDDAGHIMRDGHCVRTLHAEENALLQCAIDGISPVGATMYTTASSCWDCAKRVVRVGISRIVFGSAYDSRYGLSSDAHSLLTRCSVAVDYLDVNSIFINSAPRYWHFGPGSL